LYAWDSLPSDAGRSDPWVSSDLLAARVMAAVDRELAAKGYRLDGEGEPDFLVDFHAAVEDVLELAETWTAHESPAAAPARAPGGHPVQARDLDPRRRGPHDPAADLARLGHRRVDEELRPEKIDPQIDEAGSKILARFPPAS
jgi:hypothetical protein